MLFWMNIIKKIKNRISENYNSNKGYLFVKILLWWLMSSGIISALRHIILIILGKDIESDIAYNILLIFIFVLTWILLDGVVESIFLSSWKIMDNMVKLPKNIWKKGVIVEYDLPKNITPSEAAILLYWRNETSNLLCLIYERVNEKKVKLYVKNWKKYLEKIQDLENDASYYEKFLFASIFDYNKWPVLFNKDLLSANKLQFNDLVVSSCEKKWYIDNNVEIKGIKSLSVTKDHPTSKQITKNNYSIWCLLFAILLFCLPFFWSILGGFWLFTWFILFMVVLINYRFNVTYYINLTDKWKEALSQIYWYKYYLEHCEEEQINSDLDEGEVYSKHLPYAIALKLNWKIIKELY